MFVSKNVLIIVLVSTLVIIIASPIGFSIWENYHSKYSYGEIVIHKDRDFKKYNFPGSGTENDPYLIENLDISTELRYVIYIDQTTSFFEIRNCEISFSQIGIYLENIKDGTAKIENNMIKYRGGSISSFLRAIDVESSPEIKIYNNICILDEINNEGCGISIYKSPYSKIVNNTCTGFFSGIDIGISDFIEIKKNYCGSNYFGIDVARSYYCVIYQNTLIYNIIYGMNINYCEEYLSTNTIFHNNFLYNMLNNPNRSQAYDWNGDRWFNSTLLEGNYWSDLNWTEEAIYEIEGHAKVSDPYPLQYPILI